MILKMQPEDDFGLIVNKLRFGNTFIEDMKKYPDRRAFLKLHHNGSPCIAMEHIFLAAVSHGLNACFIGYLDIDKASEILNLPKHIVCLFLLPVGYADEVPVEKPLKSTAEITFYDKWKKGVFKMMDNHGFDLWAAGYDEMVNLSDEDNAYPFVGYKKIMNDIYGTVMKKCPASVLDIGIGTGVLATKLYDAGHTITGIDFSEKMLEKCKIKMPEAELIQNNIKNGLPDALKNKKFDFIVSTYALHHLTDEEKVVFINSLLPYLNNNGEIIIGDVCFETRRDMERCAEAHEDEWDDEEYYFIFSELNELLLNKFNLSYFKYSHCGGVIHLMRKSPATP